MFLDRRCPGCLRASSSLCATCLHRLQGAAVVKGSRHFDSVPPELDAFTAALMYDALVSRVVLAAKNGGRRDLLRLLGRRLGLALEPTMVEGKRPAVVTWVPASRSRRRRRGYDQGQLLARLVADHLEIKSRRLLTRRRGEAQANLGRVQRLRGPSLTVTGRVPPTVLVVDDVATTGASLAAVALALRSGGARRVDGGVVAVARSVPGGRDRGP